MRKILILTYFFLCVLFLFSCQKGKNNISKNEDIYLSNTRYNLVGNFNFRDKIFIKNKSIWLSKSLVSRGGKFIFKDDEKDFIKYINDFKNQFRAIFKVEGQIISILSENGLKPSYKAYFKEKEYNYEMVIDKSMLDFGNLENFIIPLKDGLKFEILYKNKNGNTQKKIMQIPILFYDDYKSYPFTQTIDNFDSIKYDFLTDENKKDKLDTILFVPGILKPSIRYKTLAEQLFYKYDKKVDVLILNLPGIYGSTNNREYHSMENLKIWLYKFIKSLSVKSLSFVGIDEGAALVQAFTSDIKYMREFIFNGITFINPISPKGLSLYKDDSKKTPYENPIELLDNKSIKNTYDAIKNRDYDFFNKKLSIDDYFKKMSKDEKIDYIKIILSQKGYSSLVYLFLNFNLFGYYENNNYKNIQNSKGYNYTYVKTIKTRYLKEYLEYGYEKVIDKINEEYIKYAERVNFDKDYNIAEDKSIYMSKFNLEKAPDRLMIHNYKKEILQPGCLYVYTRDYLKNNLKTFFDQKSCNISSFLYIENIFKIDNIVKFTSEYLDYLKISQSQDEKTTSPNLLLRFYIECLYALKNDNVDFLKNRWELVERSDYNESFETGRYHKSNINKPYIEKFLFEFYLMFAFDGYANTLRELSNLHYVPRLLKADYDINLNDTEKEYNKFFNDLLENNFMIEENEFILNLSRNGKEKYLHFLF